MKEYKSFYTQINESDQQISLNDFIVDSDSIENDWNTSKIKINTPDNYKYLDYKKDTTKADYQITHIKMIKKDDYNAHQIIKNDVDDGILYTNSSNDVYANPYMTINKTTRPENFNNICIGREQIKREEYAARNINNTNRQICISELPSMTGFSNTIKINYENNPDTHAETILSNVINNTYDAVKTMNQYLKDAVTKLNDPAMGKCSVSYLNRIRKSINALKKGVIPVNDSNILDIKSKCEEIELEYRRQFNKRKEKSFYENPYHAYLGSSKTELIAIKHLAKIDKPNNNRGNTSNK